MKIALVGATAELYRIINPVESAVARLRRDRDRSQYGRRGRAERPLAQRSGAPDGQRDERRAGADATRILREDHT